MGAEWIRRIEFIVIVALIINAQVILLITSHTYLPTIERTGYANIEQWYDGTLIYAHNYLSGANFDDTKTMTMVYADGSTKQFEVSRTIVIDNADWTATILDYSTPETITLATCYTPGMIWIAELKEANNDQDSHSNNLQRASTLTR